MKTCDLCIGDRNKYLSMSSLLEIIFEMLLSFCMSIDRMLKQTLFELASNGTLCTICGFYVVFAGIWLMWKRLGCVHTLTMLSPWLHCTFNRYWLIILICISAIWYLLLLLMWSALSVVVLCGEQFIDSELFLGRSRLIFNFWKFSDRSFLFLLS